jgi:hypothetical protein
MARNSVSGLMIVLLLGSAQAAEPRAIPDFARVVAGEAFKGSFTPDCANAAKKIPVNVTATVVGLGKQPAKELFTLRVASTLYPAISIKREAQLTGQTTATSTDDMTRFTLEFQGPWPQEGGAAVLVLASGNSIETNPVQLVPSKPCDLMFSQSWWTLERNLGSLTFTKARALLDLFPIVVFLISTLVMMLRLPKLQTVTQTNDEERYVSKTSDEKQRVQASLRDRVIGDVGWKLDSLAANATVLTALISFSSTFTLLTAPKLLSKEMYQLYQLLPPALCLFGAAIYIFSSQRVRNASQVIKALGAVADETPKITAWNFVWVYVVSNALILAGVASQLASTILLIAEFSFAGLLQMPHVIAVSIVMIVLAVYASTYLGGHVYTTIWLVGERWTKLKLEKKANGQNESPAEAIKKQNLTRLEPARTKLRLP